VKNIGRGGGCPLHPPYPLGCTIGSRMKIDSWILNCRCANCFECPSCGNALSTRATAIAIPSDNPEEKTTAKKVFYLACGFCRWSTRDVAIPDRNNCRSYKLEMLVLTSLNCKLLVFSLGHQIQIFHVFESKARMNQYRVPRPLYFFHCYLVFNIFFSKQWLAGTWQSSVKESMCFQIIFSFNLKWAQFSSV
jgi:hypothetical protein